MSRIPVLSKVSQHQWIWSQLELTIQTTKSCLTHRKNGICCRIVADSSFGKKHLFLFLSCWVLLLWMHLVFIKHFFPWRGFVVFGCMMLGMPEKHSRGIGSGELKLSRLHWVWSGVCSSSSVWVVVVSEITLGRLRRLRSIRVRGSGEQAKED